MLPIGMIGKEIRMKSKKLSIVIPCYNEATKIRKNIQEVETFVKSLIQEPAMKKIIKTYEIIVLNDGSKDNTAEEITAAKSRWVKPVSNDTNHGKGYVVRQGFELAEGEYVLFMDADLAIDLKAIRKALLIMAENPHTAIIGSRKNPQSYIEGKDMWYRKLMSWTLNRITQNALPLKGIRDTQCGFKMYPHVYAKFIAEKQLMERFSFDLEQLLVVLLNGGKVMDIPVHYYKQTTTTVRPVHDTLLFMKDLLIIRNNYKKGRYKKAYERTIC